MATAKISGLPLPTLPLAGPELFEMVQGGVSKQVGASYVAAAFATDPANVLPLTAGGTGATSATAARTSLGATTVGASLFTLANPTAITFPRINADNSVSALTASAFRTATSSAVSGANGDITSLTGLTTPLSVPQGGTGAATLTGYVKGTGTTAMTASATIPAADLTGTLPVANGGTGAATLTGYVKGAGTAAMTASATIPYADLAGRAYLQAYSVSDQSGSVSAATAVQFPLTDAGFGQGISMVVNGSGNFTRIQFAVAGMYEIAPSLQFANSGAADYDVTIWLRQNGTDVANSATTITIPKVGDGGAGFFQLVILVRTTAVNEYVEIMWLPENVAVTVEYTAAGAIAPAIPSALVYAERVA
jgi:hypothetical protein